MMSKMQSITFVSSGYSAFTPQQGTGLLRSSPTTTSHKRHGASNTVTMVAPKHVRRTEEIKRLTEQLEQLREKRKAILSNDSTPSTASTPPPAAPTTPTPTSSSSLATDSAFPLGKHSSGNRFLSISSVDSEEYHPRVLLIAGSIPDLKTSDFLNIPPMLYNKPPTKGNLFLSRLPENYNGDFVTMPTFESLAKCGDPVAVLVPAEHISATKLPITPGDEVVLVVDRDVSELEFSKSHFYAWDVNGMIRVGWVDQFPSADSNVKCVGRVMYGHLEVDNELRTKKSCWEEENETYA